MDRPANDITTEARTVGEVYLIDPTTKLPYAAGGGGGGSGDASASNQVTGNTRLGDVTETAPASDTASSGLNGRLQRIAQRLTSFMALFPASLGSKAASASLAVTDSTEDIARMGIVTETAPASDTASSGVNGRLQRIAQRITSLITALTDGTARAVLNAGSAIIGKVGIDQTTPGTTNAVVMTRTNGTAVDPDTPAIIESGVKYVDVTLSTDTAAYASGDLIADAQIVAACVRSNDATGALHSIMVIDEDDQKAAFTIYLASASSTWGTENSAPSISDANARTILGFVDVATGDYKDLGGVAVAFKGNAGMAITPATGTDDIYVAVVNGTGTPTYTASGLKLRLGFLI